MSLQDTGLGALFSAITGFNTISLPAHACMSIKNATWEVGFKSRQPAAANISCVHLIVVQLFVLHSPCKRACKLRRPSQFCRPWP